MVIVRDCVGTYTEEGHNAALKRIERFADVVESKELIDIWAAIDRHGLGIRAILEKFRRGDQEEAFYDLLELPGELLPDLIREFDTEPEPHVRALLIKVAWERKENGIVPFLQRALKFPMKLVWQQALDGLVAFASPEVHEILLNARAREFADDNTHQPIPSLARRGDSAGRIRAAAKR